MLFASDDDDFPVRCADCLHEFYEKVGRLKTGQGARCPECAILLKLTAEQFDRVVEDARKSPHDWFRQFASLRLPD